MFESNHILQPHYVITYIIFGTLRVGLDATSLPPT